MLHDWLNRPHIASRWDGPVTFETVQRKFQDHIHSEKVFGYIASFEGKPFAYVQSYAAAALGDGWWPEIAAGTWGIDQSIADEENLGKGLGTLMVRQFVSFVFFHHRASAIITDPAPDNPRAIRCYEKAGFSQVGLTTTPDGTAILMKMEHP